MTRNTLLTAALLLPGLVAAQETNADEGIEWVTGAELADAIKAGAGLIVVDVRSESSYKRGHIPGAISIPLTVIQSNTEVGLKPEDMIVFYCDCGHGGIALTAARIMRDRGYPNLWVLIGGTREYPEALEVSPDYEQ